MSVDTSANQGRTPVTSERRVRFGAFELDVAGGELTKSGARVHLQEQPARLLAVLVENAGRIVGRDELRQCLWPDNTFVDFDHGLNTAIRKLRIALDDTADTPRWIETVPRSGYRFIGPVEVIGDPSRVPATTRALRALRSWIVGVAILVAIAVAVAAWFAQHRTARGVAIDAVAVLPFANADTQTRHMSDGVTEALINGLAELGDLRVMARTTVFELAEKPIEPKRVGRELDVRAVIAGTFRLEGERLSLQVEMIDVRDGALLWGRRYEGPRRSLQALQQQIIGDLSSRLRPGAPRGGSPRPLPSSTGPDAYELYLKGLHAWNKRGPDDLELAVQYFQEALNIDPQFALAWAGLANAWGVMAGGWYPSSIMQPRALVAAENALAIDPNLAEAITSRAAGMYQQGFDFEGAEREYRRAIALNPSYPTAHAWYGQFLTDLGRLDEARAQTELAYQLDPLSPAINWNLCWIYVCERRYEEAIAFGRKVAALDVRFRPRVCLFQSLSALGRDEEAITELTFPGLLLENERAAMLEAYRRGGRREAGEYWIEAARRRSSKGYVSPSRIAGIYAWAGDADRAFAWLERARAEGASGVASFYQDPSWDPVRHDPRFQQFARKIRLPQVLNRPPAK